MKIYIKEIYNEDMTIYKYESFELGKEEFCCEDMYEAWDLYIGFGVKDSFGGKYNNSVNIHYYEYGWDEYEINYCPFCGEKIEKEVKEKVKNIKIKKRRSYTETIYKEEPIKNKRTK